MAMLGASNPTLGASANVGSSSNPSMWDYLFNSADIAKNDMNQGFNSANQYLQPYYSGGVDDYNKYRGDINSMGKGLQPYNNAGANMYNQINMSPQDFYNQMMKGYSESPQAQQQMADMSKATNAAASASGMMGSGSFYDQTQRNAQNIIAQDQDRYYGNVMNANNQQLKYLNNLQGQQSEYRNALNGLSGMGYNAGTQMGNWDVQKAQAQAMADMMQSKDLTDLIGQGMGAASKLPWKSIGKAIGGFF